MEIGTTNISAMIGPYVVPLATATEKFGIPYFVTTALQHSFYRPYNMISVSPDPVDLLVLTTELARRYHWPELAVLYDTQEGMDTKLRLSNRCRVECLRRLAILSHVMVTGIMSVVTFDRKGHVMVMR